MKIQFIIKESDEYNSLFNNAQFIRFLKNETDNYRNHYGVSLDSFRNTYKNLILLAVSSFEPGEYKDELLKWIIRGVLNKSIKLEDLMRTNFNAGNSLIDDRDEKSFLKSCLENFAKYSDKLEENGHSIDINDYSDCSEINRIIIPFMLEDLENKREASKQDIYNQFGFSPEEISKLQESISSEQISITNIHTLNEFKKDERPGGGENFVYFKVPISGKINWRSGGRPSLPDYVKLSPMIPNTVDMLGNSISYKNMIMEPMFVMHESDDGFLRLFLSNMWQYEHWLGVNKNIQLNELNIKYIMRFINSFF